jgi:hypothetical protein
LAVWVTLFELTAVAAAVDVFVCAAGAVGVGVAVEVAGVFSGMKIWISVPRAAEPAGSTASGSIETETFAFVGAICVELDVALASCFAGAL